jgi:hypothetical protein
MNIAADLCVYTNHTHMIEVLESNIKDNDIVTKWIPDWSIKLIFNIIKKFNVKIVFYYTKLRHKNITWLTLWWIKWFKWISLARNN